MEGELAHAHSRIAARRGARLPRPRIHEAIHGISRLDVDPLLAEGGGASPDVGCLALQLRPGAEKTHGLSEAAANVARVGEISMIDVAENAALQHAVGPAIARAQALDPLAPVTLIVDSAAQAWALRRQLAGSAKPGSGVANVRAMTLLEFVAELAKRIGSVFTTQLLNRRTPAD